MIVDNVILFTICVHNTIHSFRSGVSLEKLDELSVIHVSGTKGKGSTCAFCESILRRHGYKTGFYSSPHLVAVRERIRINGQPLSQHDFARYFWRVYNSLTGLMVLDILWYFLVPMQYQVTSLASVTHARSVPFYIVPILSLKLHFIFL
jgi:hypothetical protein